MVWPDLEVIKPGSFDPMLCYEANGDQVALHQTVLKFFGMSNLDIVEIYLKSNPKVSKLTLLDLLNAKTRHFYWGGSDVMPYEDFAGNKGMSVIEINTCPAGSSCCAQKNYARVPHTKVIEEAMISRLPKSGGVLAVLYNLPKNHPDIYGYSCALADAAKEDVHLVNLGPTRESRPNVIRWVNDRKPEIFVEQQWQPVRATFIRLGLQPWKQVPITTEGLMVNPLVALIGGGHNKLSAARAFEDFNKVYQQSNIQVDTPTCYAGVTKAEILAIAEKLDFLVAIKYPYAAAGVGIYLISNKSELSTFMESEDTCERYVVQSLIAGHPGWFEGKSNVDVSHRRFHRLGRRPNFSAPFVYDLRFIIANDGNKGWKPTYLIGRWAKSPPNSQLPDSTDDVMKTNMSRVQKDEKQQHLDWSASLILSEENFELLGLSIEDLVDGYVQSVLSAIAIDRLCDKLTPNPGEFDLKFFLDYNRGDMRMLREMAEATTDVKRAIETGEIGTIHV